MVQENDSDSHIPQMKNIEVKKNFHYSNTITVPTCDPSSQEAEAGRPGIPAHSGIHSKRNITEAENIQL